ncbi:MAG: hypothetical protein QOK43_279 [Acidimicrobiaceae bacterium]|nr:hypothetical protein [Acidimicrobiaceae bacterium]
MTQLVEAGIGTLMAIHNAFRRDLDRLVASAQLLAGEGHGASGDGGAGAVAGAAAVQAYWSAFEVELRDHHRVEDEEIYVQVAAALGDEATSVLAEMEGEHAALVGALDQVEVSMRTLAVRADGAVAADAAQALAAQAAQALAGLQSLLVPHLAHEEAECVPLIRRAADDEYMTAFFARRQAEAVPARYLPWVLDGADPATTERIVSVLPPPAQRLLSDVWRPARQALVDALPQP